MKPSFGLTTLAIALAATFTAALPEPARGEPDDVNAWCEWKNPGWVFDYRVVIKEVDDAGAICDRLWKGLKQHEVICMVSKPWCGKAFLYEKGLEWRFRVGMGCDVGAVQSGFWEATQNKFGALDVSKCQG